MGRRVAVIAAMCTVAVLAIALPATANNKPRTGERINLRIDPPATFAANTPFYIEHGWGCALHDQTCFAQQIAKGDFDLYLDNVLQASTADVHQTDSNLFKLELTNYPSGLPPGTYTFVGVWTLSGSVSFTNTVTITFG